jgi:hypothetical protein
MAVPVLLHIGLGMCVGVCALLLGLFYSTPGIGYSAFHDTGKNCVHCFCIVICKTSPHFGFLLHVLSGVLLLALCIQAMHEEDSADRQTVTLVLAIIFFVSFTGLLSFDLMHHTDVHCVFVTVLFTSALVFSLYSLHLDNAWHMAGTAAYCVALAVFFLSPSVECLLSGCDDLDRIAVNTINCSQLICITTLVFVLGVYVYT